MNTFLLWILLYSFLMVAIGAFLSRRVRLAADFLVAGRRLGPGLVFATFLAANIGAGSTVGAAALAYEIGWSAWWWVGSAALGCFILANSVGPRIWRIAAKENLHTLGDYLELRYSRAVRGWVAAILWIGSLGLLAAQLVAISIIFHVVVGAPRWFGSVLGGCVMIAYFSAGGLFGAARVNTLQLFVLLTGFTLTAPYALAASGGWQEVVRRLSESLGDAQTAGYLSPGGIGTAGIIYYLALLTPSFIVSPGLIQKFYGARSAAAGRMGVNLNGGAMLLFALVPPLLGIVAAAQFPGIDDPQLGIFRIMTEVLPLWLGVLGLAAVFSAEVSTCDAVLFMLSTSLTVDLYKRFLNTGASEARLLSVSRLTSIAAGILGVLLAIRIPSIIATLTIFYSLVSVTLFAPVVSGLYSRRPDARAALAAIGASIPATLILQRYFGNTILGILNPYLLGIALSFAVLWISTLRRNPLPHHASRA